MYVLASIPKEFIKSFNSRCIPAEQTNSNDMFLRSLTFRLLAPLIPALYATGTARHKDKYGLQILPYSLQRFFNGPVEAVFLLPRFYFQQ